MMRMVMVLGLIALSESIIAQVQPQDTIEYIHGLPVTGQDTLEQQETTNDRPPGENLMLVKHDELPPKLRRALQRHEQYKGWEKSRIYHDRNTGLYLVRIVNGNTVTTFGMNDRGKPVTFDESSGQDNP